MYLLCGIKPDYMKERQLKGVDTKKKYVLIITFESIKFILFDQANCYPICSQFKATF